MSDLPRLSELTASMAQMQGAGAFVRLALCLAAADGKPQEAAALAAPRFKSTTPKVAEILGSKEAEMILRCATADRVLRDAAAAFPNEAGRFLDPAAAREAISQARGSLNATEAMILRAAVAPADTTTSGWASQLVDFGRLVQAFLDALAPRTIIGRLPGLVRAPFNRRVAIQTDAAAGSWVAENAPMPILALSFDQSTLAPKKLQAATVVSKELATTMGPAAESFISRALLRCNSRALDEAFIDPTNAGSAAKPAAVTNGAPEQPCSGATIAEIMADALAVMDALIALGSDLAGAAWVMSPRSARYLGGLRNTQDVFAFPQVGPAGGTWFNLPVLTSTAVPLVDSPATTTIALVDPARILIADDGELGIDATEQASLQMRTDPQTGGQQVVSLWANNLRAVRTTRTISWSAQEGACAIISGVTY